LPEMMGAWGGQASRYSPEVRERAVGVVMEHQAEHASQRAALGSIAAEIGCWKEASPK